MHDLEALAGGHALPPSALPLLVVWTLFLEVSGETDRLVLPAASDGQLNQPLTTEVYGTVEEWQRTSVSSLLCPLQIPHESPWGLNPDLRGEKPATPSQQRYGQSQTVQRSVWAPEGRRTENQPCLTSS
jgi:hypothetical protein